MTLKANGAGEDSLVGMLAEAIVAVEKARILADQARVAAAIAFQRMSEVTELLQHLP